MEGIFLHACPVEKRHDYIVRVDVSSLNQIKFCHRCKRNGRPEVTWYKISSYKRNTHTRVTLNLMSHSNNDILKRYKYKAAKLNLWYS